MQLQGFTCVGQYNTSVIQRGNASAYLLRIPKAGWDFTVWFRKSCKLICLKHFFPCAGKGPEWRKQTGRR